VSSAFNQSKLHTLGAGSSEHTHTASANLDVSLKGISVMDIEGGREICSFPLLLHLSVDIKNRTCYFKGVVHFKKKTFADYLLTPMLSKMSMSFFLQSK